MILRLLGALKTSVWLLTGLVVVLFVGSVVMPALPSEYLTINDELLFDWLRGAGKNPAHAWFFLALGLLVCLTLNTLVCSVESIARRSGGGEFLLRISPQIMHAGFLFILLAHFMSGGWGFKMSGTLPEGQAGGLPGGRVLFLKDLRIDTYPSGMPRSWSADLEVYHGREKLGAGRAEANTPFFLDGVGYYLKNITMTSAGPAAVLYVSRDPGALFALLGAILFALGNVVFLGLRVRSGA